jgi:hypothetical protein
MPRKPKFDAYVTASALRRQIAETPEDQLETIPELFAALQIAPMERYAVFQLLDEKPGNWSDRNDWHWKLRRVRNAPDIGRRLFATFR